MRYAIVISEAAKKNRFAEQTSDRENGWNPSFIEEEQPWRVSMVRIRDQKLAVSFVTAILTT